jgi:hypothetical protein
MRKEVELREELSLLYEIDSVISSLAHDDDDDDGINGST